MTAARVEECSRKGTKHRALAKPDTTGVAGAGCALRNLRVTQFRIALSKKQEGRRIYTMGKGNNKPRDEGD